MAYSTNFRAPEGYTLCRESMWMLPKHWEVPEVNNGGVFASLHLIIFRVLCLLSIGHRSLRHTYPNVVSGQEVWDLNRAHLQHRVENTTVVCGLLLATTAVFITTAPPSQQTLNYMAATPYVFILLSFGLALGGLIVGSAVIFVISTCNVDWFRDKWTRTRLRLYCILFLISYPHISVGISGSMCAIGLVLAARLSENPVISIGSIFVILLPASTFHLFTWIIL